MMNFLIRGVCGTALDPEMQLDKEVTGVSISQERGTDEMEVQILQGQTELGRLKMDLETARMIRTGLNQMRVLDEENRQ